jgi:toxin YoeB
VNLLFTPVSWGEFKYWAETDRQVFKRLNTVIEDTRRSPFEGIGKPEPLKGNLAGLWSRRITGEHRLIYFVANYHIGRTLVITQCRYHY